MASPLHITTNQLARLIGTSSAPVVIDVRIPEHFNEDPQIIPTVIRHPRWCRDATDEVHSSLSTAKPAPST